MRPKFNYVKRFRKRPQINPSPNLQYVFQRDEMSLLSNVWNGKGLSERMSHFVLSSKGAISPYFLDFLVVAIVSHAANHLKPCKELPKIVRQKLIVLFKAALECLGRKSQPFVLWDRLAGSRYILSVPHTHTTNPRKRLVCQRTHWGVGGLWALTVMMGDGDGAFPLVPPHKMGTLVPKMEPRDKETHTDGIVCRAKTTAWNKKF